MISGGLNTSIAELKKIIEELETEIKESGILREIEDAEQSIFELRIQNKNNISDEWEFETDVKVEQTTLDDFDKNTKND